MTLKTDSPFETDPPVFLLKDLTTRALGGATGLGSRLLEACRPRDSSRVDAPTTRPAPRFCGAKSPFSSARPRAHAQPGFTFAGLDF